ncbi:hypothetical protein Bbelb_019440 [Branchiostoma belcheri]|nr:hypothetical protein Bbelb_019440 [Branchiostoma belcheri]
MKYSSMHSIDSMDSFLSSVQKSRDWTLEESSSLPVIGLEDKRQITLLLAFSLSGTLLPPKVFYQGETDACHARFDFSRSKMRRRHNGRSPTRRAADEAIPEHLAEESPSEREKE